MEMRNLWGIFYFYIDIKNRKGGEDNMKEFIVEHFLEIFFMVLSTVLIGFLKSEHKKNKELKQYREEDQNKKYREMVLSEIKPIIQEIHTIQTDLDTKIKALETHHDGDKDAFDIKIKDLEKEYERALALIIASYKFRLIQLCQTHLNDGYIT
jgi:hypothetical protein